VPAVRDVQVERKQQPFDAGYSVAYERAAKIYGGTSKNKRPVRVFAQIVQIRVYAIKVRRHVEASQNDTQYQCDPDHFSLHYD
jgi:hypothetical protein